MKSFIAFMLLVSASAQATSLFSYTVFTKANIYGECSDFLGRTGAGGDVYLRDFLIQASDKKNCPLEVKGSLKMVRGSVENGEHWSCFNAGYFSFDRTGYDHAENYSVNYADLSAQMDKASQTLACLGTSTAHRVLNLNGAELKSNSVLEIEGSGNQSVVINVAGKKVMFEKMTIALKGGLKPSQIIWNFPEASEVVVRHSGVNQGSQTQDIVIGFPGTILAPSAEVSMNNVLITGAVFAHSYVGVADAADCSGLVSGQVNPACFRSTLPGIGCKSPSHGK